ncbi:MAG TPA: helical backbone metal receptor [Ohtaekwangia sp.]
MSQPVFCDQMGYSLSFVHPPKRIISLVPSQTELLAELGLSTEVVGITKFCIHPRSWFTTKPKIGGTKQFDFNAIKNLNPDLIIGNKEENYKEGIEDLRKNYSVWMSDIQNLDDATQMIHSLAAIADKSSAGENIISIIQERFVRIKVRPPQTVLYLIWRKPWMAAGTGTFINDMLCRLNLRNVISAGRYPELSDEQISSLKPDLIFLSSEPYPFKADHKTELRQISPESNITLVDGEMFSWYGSRLMHAPAYFNSLQFT